MDLEKYQVERPPANNNNHRKNDRKNSLSKTISPRKTDNRREVTAGGDTSKMPRGYRARKSVQSNNAIGPGPSPEETKLEIEKIKQTLVQKQSVKSPIKPRSYDRFDDPKSESDKKPEPKKSPKTDTWYALKKPDADSKSISKSGPKAAEKVQQPAQNSRKNRRKKSVQFNQKSDMPSKIEVSVPKPGDKSKTSLAPSQKQAKITTRSKNDSKMTKSNTSDRKIVKKVENPSNSTSKMSQKIDITKIDQSLVARNKRTNKTSRREVFDETKNPEQTIRTLMHEQTKTIVTQMFNFLQKRKQTDCYQAYLKNHIIGIGSCDKKFLMELTDVKLATYYRNWLPEEPGATDDDKSNRDIVLDSVSR